MLGMHCLHMTFLPTAFQLKKVSPSPFPLHHRTSHDETYQGNWTASHPYLWWHMLPLYPASMAKFSCQWRAIRLLMGNITKLQLLLPYAAALPASEACMLACCECILGIRACSSYRWRGG